MAAAVEAALRPLVGASPGVGGHGRTRRAHRRRPAFLTVEDVARQAGATPRQLQRRFADHVGIGPKAVIRRYRLYEAAEQAGVGAGSTGPRWRRRSATATRPTLTRDFTGHFGLPPGRYVAANTPA